MAEVVLNNVRKNYDPAVHKDTLRNINLAIKEGEFIVFVGPSGCGKSTLLRMIAGLEDITSGELTIGGRYMNDVPPVERNVGMVFQSYALYPHMNIYENMAFGLKLKKMDKENIHKRVMRAAEILGLEPLLDRKPKALSGGQRQRVAIGRAIVRDPALFLFDEPLSNLDAKLRNEMRLNLKQLHQQLHTTIIYVTHDQVEAMTLADRIVVLNQGRIEQVGTPQSLYDTPANRFVAGFIGTPGMNFLDGQWRDGQFHLAQGLALSGLPAGTATLGVRPNQIRIDAQQRDLELPIDLVEPLGHSWLCYGQIGATRIAVESPRPVNRGDHLPLALAHSVCHCFAADGQRLTTRGAGHAA